MSYGDDADSPWDRGTRVEASKRWHEQNQLRHDYSYRSASKPKSTYKPKTTNKSTYKPKYSNKTIYAYKSTSTSANNYSTSNYDSHKRLDFYDIMCANCDTIYDTRVHKSCPTCGRIPPRIPRKYNSRSKSNGDRWIIGLYCIGILLIFIIFALMW